MEDYDDGYNAGWDAGHDVGIAATAERERALREEVEALRGKCNRLQMYAAEIAEHLPIEVTDDAMRDAADRAMLENDDLDEPHGAARETSDA